MFVVIDNISDIAKTLDEKEEKWTGWSEGYGPFNSEEAALGFAIKTTYECEGTKNIKIYSFNSSGEEKRNYLIEANCEEFEEYKPSAIVLELFTKKEL